MNEKEIAEIRRRFKTEKNNITHVCGCYVNDQREIVSQFDQSFLELPAEETEKMLAILRRTLSGTIGKNLINLSFSTQQVVKSEEHQLLMALRDTALRDPVFTQALYQRIIDTLQMDGSYLILLATEPYDVPVFTKDGERDELSSSVYSYVLCSICPVKETKPALCYDIPGNTFRSLQTDWLVSPPELGFLFPAFEDRAANLYGSLYYTRSTADNHPELVDVLFKTEIPAPADVQKETFESVLGDALQNDCSLDVVQAVHQQLHGLIEEHKAEKDPEPLTVSRNTVRNVLASCGVETDHVTDFEERFDEAFGAESTLIPQNLMDTRRFEVKTPDVTIQVNPERSDLVETRIIDGARYILIRADEGVQVNGIDVHIS